MVPSLHSFVGSRISSSLSVVYSRAKIAQIFPLDAVEAMNTSQADVTRTVAEIAEQAAHASEIFRQCDALGSGSRLQHYVQILREYSNVDSKDIARRGATRLVSDVMLETADLIEIATLPIDYLKNQKVLERLKCALEGRLLRRHHLPRQTDQAREATFELCTAAYLQRSKILGPPPTDSADVTLQLGDALIPVECKRPTSLRGLKDNLRSAKKQIRRRAGASGRGASFGFVVVDLSRALNVNTTQFHYSSREHMLEAASRRFHEAIEANLERIQHRDVETQELLGAAIRLILPGYAGSSANARRYIEWTFVPLRYDSVSKELFKLCVEPFGDGDVSERASSAVKLAIPILYFLGEPFLRAYDVRRPSAGWVRGATELSTIVAR